MKRTIFKTKRIRYIFISLILITAGAIGYKYFTKKEKLAYDVNNDGKIGISDITLITMKMNEECADCPEDLNNDGIINQDDYTLIMEYFN